ncbi:flagellar basal body rod protein FlgC [bacterium]|nr:flagellar basal body rod protein FlgC [bacterium]
MGVLDAMYTGSDALRVHGLRIDVCAKNMANVDTPNYQRKISVLSATKAGSFGGILGAMNGDDFSSVGGGVIQGGVSMSAIADDPDKGERIYKPGHPDADENGYIRASNVNPSVEMADAILAQRAYEANLALVNTTRSMAFKALDIGK